MKTTWTRSTNCGKPQAEPCCEHDCTSGTRNRYYTGKRLTPDALRVEQDYQIARRHLTNRAMHGWGVVYGYPVALEGAKLAIGAGLAFDRMGRELVQTETAQVPLDDLLELPGESGESGECYLLRVHYAEHLIAPVLIKDACSCERQQWDNVCETVRFSLQRIECAACCDAQACELVCACCAGPCCGGDQDDREQTETAVRQRQRIGHDKPRDGAFCCMCEHLTALSPGAQCGALSEVSERVRADLHNGVPLACVALDRDECGNWRLAAVTDACGPRRLVKRNDLLFDLIRGCDLTRISGISWAEWHRSPSRVSWEEFDSFFADERSPEGGCATNFTVMFSRPVRKDTLLADCFKMTFYIRQREGGWLLPLHAPIVRLDYGDESGEEVEFATRASLVVSWGWVSDALRGLATEFERGGVAVEIEVRGDFILDCNGQAVDADARGRAPAPSGNGTPGGTFLSRFELDEQPSRPDPDSATLPGTDTGGNLS